MIELGTKELMLDKPVIGSTKLQNHLAQFLSYRDIQVPQGNTEHTMRAVERKPN